MKSIRNALNTMVETAMNVAGSFAAYLYFYVFYFIVFQKYGERPQLL